MMHRLTETITIDDVDVVRFAACMQPELDALDAKRFTYKLKTKGEEVIFTLKASDDVAMKAARSSIQKFYTVFKKMDGLEHGKRSISGKTARTSDA